MDGKQWWQPQQQKTICHFLRPLLPLCALVKKIYCGDALFLGRTYRISTIFVIPFTSVCAPPSVCVDVCVCVNVCVCALYFLRCSNYALNVLSYCEFLRTVARTDKHLFRRRKKTFWYQFRPAEYWIEGTECCTVEDYLK